jgi:hypothetical protein
MPFADQLDARILQAILTKTKITLASVNSQVARRIETQISQPLRVGGFGFRRLVSVCHAAYFAAHASSLSRIASFRGVGQHLERSSQDVGIVQCYDHLVACGVVAGVDVPSTSAQIFYGFAPGNHLQHTLVDRMEAARLQEYQESLSRLSATESQVALARTVSIQDKRAKLWLSLVPNRPETTIADQYYCVTLRALLGLPVYDDLVGSCACSVPFASDPYHLLVCTRQTGGGATTRHDYVLDVLLRLANDAGATTRRCPLMGHAPDGAKLYADLLVVSPTGAVYVDVSVVAPMASAYRVAASHSALAAARLREREKERKYSAVVAQERLRWVPFVFETTGACGPQASSFLDRLADIAEANRVCSAGRFKRRALRFLSVAVQVGNGMSVLSKVQRHREYRADDVHRLPAAAIVV